MAVRGRWLTSMAALVAVGVALGGLAGFGARHNGEVVATGQGVEGRALHPVAGRGQGSSPAGLAGSSLVTELKSDHITVTPLDPPDRRASAIQSTVSAATAIARASAAATILTSKATVTTTILVSMTDHDYGVASPRAHVGSDSTKLRYVAVPVWVVEVTGARVPLPGGPLLNHGSVPSNLVWQRTSIVVFINAATGAFVELDSVSAHG